MRAILSDIRALAGVTGIAVLGKRDGRIEHMFPAAFTDRHTEKLLDLVTQTYQKLRGFSRLALRFERVVVHLFNQPEFLLFVTVLPDTDDQHFESVVRSKFIRIDHLLARTRPEPGGLRVGQPSATKPAGDPVAVFVDVLNGISAELKSVRGMARLSVDWRQARDFVAESHEVLTALAVDPSGMITIRKGRHLEPNAETVEALVRLADRFLELVGTARPVAEDCYYTQLERHKSVLEPCGVFLFLNQGRRPRRPASQ